MNENNIEKKKYSIKNLITVLIFLALIGIFTIISLIKEDTGFSENENRVMTAKPEFTMEALLDGSYTTTYQVYVRDQFPIRNTFVSLKNYCEAAINKTEINGVLICEDDYYIEAHDRQNYESELAVTNMEALASFVKRYEQELGSNHISTIIAPTAQTVLTNKFKSGMYAYDQNIYLDKIKAEIGDDIFINACETLKNHNEEYIYYRTDHHWTTYGAFLVYEKWAAQKGMDAFSMEQLDIREVSDEFLGTINSKLNMNMKKDTISEYTVRDVDFFVDYNMGMSTSDSLFFNEYLGKKDKYSYFLGGNPGLVDITSNANNDKILLIIKDSYANCIAPVYAAGFEKTYIIDLRFFNMDVDDFIKENGVTDIVVIYNADSFATDKYVKRIK